MIGNSAVKRLNALRETDFREELCVGCVRFDNIEHLEKLSADDLLTFRLYANNDSANILWEYGIPSSTGLKVSYALPTPEVEIKPDLNAASNPQEMTAYRTLGGVRLKLEYRLKPGETFESTPTWDLPFEAEKNIGCFKDFKMADADGNKLNPEECKAVMDQDPASNALRFYWQPDWKADNVDTTLTVHVRGADGTLKTAIPKVIVVRFARRELQPQETDTMVGSDVAMLEQMLWQLGISPSKEKGINGIRLEADKQSTYLAGIPSIEKMVKRFKGRSFATIVDDVNLGGNSQTGHVTTEVLAQLQKVWSDYLDSTQRFNKTQLGFADLNSYKDLNGTTWWDLMVAALDGTVNFENKPTPTSVTATYSDAHHKRMLVSLGLPETVNKRDDVMKAWVAQESSGVYWGGGKPQNTPYRMTEGGAEERGSFGYNQVQFTFTGYGSNKCSTLEDVNLYHPKNNLLGMVAYASKNTPNCGRSFYNAFNTVLSENFDKSFDNTNNLNATLVGYGNKLSDGSVKYVKTGSAALAPDDYDRLHKALAGYNGDGNRVFKCSLADVVIGVEKTWSKNGVTYTKECDKPFAGFRDIFKTYSAQILHDGNAENNKLKLPDRVYVWKVDDGVEVYCFAFGEKEWMNPETDPDGVVPLTWSDYKELSSVPDSIYRTNCPL